MNNPKVAKIRIPKLGNTRNKVIMLSFKILNDSAMLSFCRSHHCPPQKTHGVISISMNEDPICTHQYKSWQPELARKLVFLFNVCHSWFFRIFKPGTSSAWSTATTGFQWYQPPLQRLLELSVLHHLGQRDRDSPSFWGGAVLSIPVLPGCNMCFPSFYVQRGWTLWGSKITV